MIFTINIYLGTALQLINACDVFNYRINTFLTMQTTVSAHGNNIINAGIVRVMPPHDIVTTCYYLFVNNTMHAKRVFTIIKLQLVLLIKY
jgi:hypothetical protein